jgi:hypothetical protein
MARAHRRGPTTHRVLRPAVSCARADEARRHGAGHVVLEGVVHAHPATAPVRKGPLPDRGRRGDRRRRRPPAPCRQPPSPVPRPRALAWRSGSGTVVASSSSIVGSNPAWRRRSANSTCWSKRASISMAPGFTTVSAPLRRRMRPSASSRTSPSRTDGRETPRCWARVGSPASAHRGARPPGPPPGGARPARAPHPPTMPPPNV